MDLEDAGSRARFLIRDRDRKYPPLFDTILNDTGITVVLTVAANISAAIAVGAPRGGNLTDPYAGDEASPRSRPSWPYSRSVARSSCAVVRLCVVARNFGVELW
jgi:hypothetical protein